MDERTRRLRELLEAMRAPRSRWQHSYGSMDVIYADKADEWADELEAVLDTEGDRQVCTCRHDSGTSTSCAVHRQVEDFSPAQVQLLAWAVSNCHMLARRALAHDVNPSSREKWEHVLRICEKAGARSKGVLRLALPTEITEGSRADTEGDRLEPQEKTDAPR